MGMASEGEHHGAALIPGCGLVGTDLAERYAGAALRLSKGQPRSAPRCGSQHSSRLTDQP
jgi:hypothetical protein